MSVVLWQRFPARAPLCNHWLGDSFDERFGSIVAKNTRRR